jgi:hypothetical protein
MKQYVEKLFSQVTKISIFLNIAFSALIVRSLGSKIKNFVFLELQFLGIIFQLKTENDQPSEN